MLAVYVSLSIYQMLFEKSRHLKTIKIQRNCWYLANRTHSAYLPFCKLTFLKLSSYFQDLQLNELHKCLICNNDNNFHLNNTGINFSCFFLKRTVP